LLFFPDKPAGKATAETVKATMRQNFYPVIAWQREGGTLAPLAIIARPADAVAYHLCLAKIFPLGRSFTTLGQRRPIFCLSASAMAGIG